MVICFIRLEALKTEKSIKYKSSTAPEWVSLAHRRGAANVRRHRYSCNCNVIEPSSHLQPQTCSYRHMRWRCFRQFLGLFDCNGGLVVSKTSCITIPPADTALHVTQLVTLAYCHALLMQPLCISLHCGAPQSKITRFIVPFHAFCVQPLCHPSLT